MQHNQLQMWLFVLELLSWGGGLLKLRLLISPSVKFFILQKQILDYLNHIYIWQVPPQLNCGDTGQI